MSLPFCFLRAAFCVLYNKPGLVPALVFLPKKTAELGFALKRLTRG
jgi:hypothetical protein